MSLSPPGSPGPATPPALGRRLACLVYEGVLLFGIAMTAGLIYGVLTQQRHALTGTWGLRIFLFAVIGLYFVHCWSRTGQTLAMQTWRLRLLTVQGKPVSRLRAAVRYLLAWMWFLPALITVHLSGLQGALPATAAVVAGILAYASLVWLHPRRQYWHDALCQTQLVNWEPPPRRPKP